MRIISILFALICGLGLQAQFFNLDSWSIYNDTLKPLYIHDYAKIEVDSTFSVENNASMMYTLNGINPLFKSVTGIDLPMVGGTFQDTANGYFNIDGIIDFSNFAGIPNRYEVGSFVFAADGSSMVVNMVSENEATVSVRNDNFFRHALDVDTFRVSLNSSNFDAGYFNSFTIDTNEIEVTYRSGAYGGYNDNGFILPTLTSEPAGESGSMYFNSTTEEFRVYNGSQQRTMVTLSEGSGSPIGVVTPDHTGIMYHDTGTNHIYISVGTTSADWVKLN